MDTRQEDRFPVEQIVNLTILCDPEICLQASVKNASLRGLGIEAAQPAPPGAAVKVEFDDSIFFGDIMYCRPSDTGYSLGIRLTQVLSGLAALSKMAQDFERQLHAPAHR